MQCDGCGSYNFTLLGTLGNTTHLRCRACGLDCHMDSEELEELEEEVS